MRNCRVVLVRPVHDDRLVIYPLTTSNNNEQFVQTTVHISTHKTL